MCTLLRRANPRRFCIFSALRSRYSQNWNIYEPKVVVYNIIWGEF